MPAVYFLAGCFAGLAIAWYLTRQYYDAKSVPLKKHLELLEKLKETSGTVKKADENPDDEE